MKIKKERDNNKIIGIVVALDREIKLLGNSIKIEKEYFWNTKKIYSGYLCGKKCVVVVCGVGKVNSAVCTQYIIDKFAVFKIINIGTCGGFGERVKVGDKYIVDKAIQYDFDLSEIDDVKLGHVDGMKNQYFELNNKNIVLQFSDKTAILATSDKFTNENEDAEKVISLGCEVRDMECGAIAQVCEINNIPFEAYKYVTDVYSNKNDKMTEQYKINSHKL